MRSTWLIFLLVFSWVVTALAIAFCYTIYQIQEDIIKSFEPNAQAIRTLLGRQESAWNRGDLDGFLEGYAKKGMRPVFQSGGERIEGFENVRERYLKRYQGKKENMGTLKFSELEIQPLGLGAAFARGKYRLDFANKPPAEGRFTLIILRIGQDWKIVHDHTSSASD